MRLIMDVPLPRASSKALISCKHRVKHVTIAMARSSQAVIKAVSLHPYPLDLPYLHLRLAALLALVTHVDSFTNSRVRERITQTVTGFFQRA